MTLYRVAVYTENPPAPVFAALVEADDIPTALDTAADEYQAARKAEADAAAEAERQQAEIDAATAAAAAEGAPA